MKQAGANDEFVNLLVKNQKRLYAYILTLVPNLTDAEDVLQETNTVLLRKQDEFQPGTNFGAWAARVAYLEVCAFFRKQSKTKCFQPGDELLETLAASAESRLNESGDLLGALSHCSERLSDQDRQMISWRYRESLSARQIADRTDRTPQAIRQVLYRIRTDLLNCIRRRLAAEERSQ